MLPDGTPAGPITSAAAASRRPRAGVEVEVPLVVEQHPALLHARAGPALVAPQRNLGVVAGHHSSQGARVKPGRRPSGTNSWIRRRSRRNPGRAAGVVVRADLAAVARGGQQRVVGLERERVVAGRLEADRGERRRRERAAAVGRRVRRRRGQARAEVAVAQAALLLLHDLDAVGEEAVHGVDGLDAAPAPANVTPSARERRVEAPAARDGVA